MVNEFSSDFHMTTNHDMLDIAIFNLPLNDLRLAADCSKRRLPPQGKTTMSTKKYGAEL
jgi:hypothetical protein